MVELRDPAPVSLAGEGAAASAEEELRRAQTTLRESEERLRCLTDAAPALISYVDAAGHYRFVNRQYEVWFGHRREEIVGRHMREALGDGAVPDPSASLVAGDHASLGQHLEVMGHGWLGTADRFDQVAGTHLAGLG